MGSGDADVYTPPVTTESYFSSTSCNTTGWKYFCGLHLVFCSGIDELQRIIVGEKDVWTGVITANSRLSLNKPDVFGGTRREGGVVGNVDIEFGGPTQGPNAYLVSKLGAVMPAFRGLFGMVVNKAYLSANNPYIKAWSIQAKRVKTGWHDELASVGTGGDMNPAHIIRECLTNITWGGLGLAAADIDDVSFLAAATTLHAEGFGLSFIWDINKSLDEFIGFVVSHINGVCFFSHVTGLMTLRLIRKEDTSLAPVLDESTVIDMTSFTNTSVSEAVNQVVVKYITRDGRSLAVSVHDIAGINRADGKINSVEIEYPGVATAELAGRIAARELTQYCTPMAAVELVINRKYYDLEIGDYFRFSWEALGIANMVMRVASVEFGPFTDNALHIKAVRDIFSLSQVAFTSTAASLWQNPINPPANSPYQRVEEMTWWQFTRLYGESLLVQADLVDQSTRLICFCVKPSPDAGLFTMITRPAGGASWANKGQAVFAERATLAVSLPSETFSEIAVPSGITVAVGDYGYIDQEIVVVATIGVGTVTIGRGIMDTLPVYHAAGAPVWFTQNSFAVDREDRVVGEGVDVAMLTSTALGQLPIAEAAINPVVCGGRMMRPYPPGKLFINGLVWSQAAIAAGAGLSLVWAGRNRLAQTVYLVTQDADNIIPEPGTTYTLRIYGETDVLLKTVIGIVAPEYTYDTLTEQSDSGFTAPRLNTSLRIELEAVRGTLTSREKWNVTVNRG